MNDNMNLLLTNISNVFVAPPFVRTESLQLEETHWKMLGSYNGFYSFEGSFHFFGTSGPLFHSMPLWNDVQGWRSKYADLAEGLLFFAENVLGDQFAYGQEGILFFDAETGTKKLVGNSFDEFLSVILSDVNYYSGFLLLRDWNATNPHWSPGHHLCPKMPFVLGGEFKTNNLYLLESEKSMKFKGDLAQQIKNVPDGTPFKLKIE